MLFDMLVMVIVMQVTTLFEIEVKNLIFYCTAVPSGITPETLENNKIWICRKRSHPCFMTVDDKIRDEKLQCDINREAGKMALSSGKSDKYEYLMGEEILPFDQSRVIEQAKFNYSPLGKTLEKQVDA